MDEWMQGGRMKLERMDRRKEEDFDLEIKESLSIAVL